MLEVDEIGSFHIGGRSVTLHLRVDPHGADQGDLPAVGELEVEQMYVQYVRLVRPQSRYPLLLWHGGGATGALWETTPDGRPGWQMFFLRAGYNVYVSDAVERGRASWAPYPEVFKGTPEFSTKQGVWDVLRLGPPEGYSADPAKRQAYPGHQFPVEALDQLVKTLVPRWRTTDDAIQRAYDALVQKVGPGILIVCSQSGQFGLSAALAASEKVKALVLVEPAAIPESVSQNVTTMAKVPHLFIWGDFISGNALSSRWFEAANRYREQLQAAGGVVDWLDLPGIGIHGNGHTPMIDRNSDQVAELIRGWLTKVTG